MMKRFILLSASIAAAITLIGTALAPIVVSAQSSTSSNVEDICKGVNATGNSSGDCNDPGVLNGFISTVINTLSWIVGIVAVVMVMVGGFKFVTSGGDTEKVVSARSTILYALIGLVIVALAQVIVKFVIGRIS